MPTLTELRRLGVGLSVDDFGTGYSSLRHLSTLPVTELKIDRAFIAGLQRSANEAAIVRGIMLLGQSLGKAIVAEGIETADQVEHLRDMGCKAGQGYHLSRPMTAESIDGLLAGFVAGRPAVIDSPGQGLRPVAIH